MITKSKYKMCRRLGVGLYEKCQTPKFVASEAKRKKGDKKPKQLSEYGTQMLEKQRVRFSYGISEKQLSNYVNIATGTKGALATDKLYELLETRLDNVVYRLGLAHTRALARQMVSHGHIMVNGKKIKVASHQISAKDVITVRDGSKSSPLFTDIAGKLKSYSWPAWLTFNVEKLEATVTGAPKNTEGFLNFNTVLEYYSR
ncbi:MAG: 30S ribosomal protein S4 [Minisyncoccia bacterium]